MTANDDRVLSEILNRTIEYDPKTNVALMHFLLERRMLRVRQLNRKKGEVVILHICTGSTAELRIKPMISCIGDVDIMYHYTNDIALPRDCLKLPTRKLTGMNSTLELFLIGSLPDCPGYTNMHVGGLLSWNTQTNRYHLTTPEQVDSCLSNYGELDLHSKNCLILKEVQFPKTLV